MIKQNINDIEEKIEGKMKELLDLGLKINLIQRSFPIKNYSICVKITKLENFCKECGRKL